MSEIRFTRRKAYEVCREVGLHSISLSSKGRLLGYRRAQAVASFLKGRGHAVRVRLFGLVDIPSNARLFDKRTSQI